MGLSDKLNCCWKCLTFLTTSWLMVFYIKAYSFSVSGLCFFSCGKPMSSVILLWAKRLSYFKVSLVCEICNHKNSSSGIGHEFCLYSCVTLVFKASANKMSWIRRNHVYLLVRYEGSLGFITFHLNTQRDLSIHQYKPLCNIYLSQFINVLLPLS